MCEKTPLLVSACLVGVPCRFDGSHRALPIKTLERLLKEHIIILACPEICGGLPIPRDTISIIGGNGGDVLEGRASARTSKGQNVTENLIAGARYVLKLCEELQIKQAILKSKSLSCDPEFGITAALLKGNSIKCQSSTDFAA